MGDEAKNQNILTGEIVLPKLAVTLTMPEPEGKKEDDKPKTVTTEHSVTIDGEAIEYTATAGVLELKDDEGKARAKLFHIAYLCKGVDDTTARPITFAFNGGPGSSSVWLHLGAFGPRRVKLGPEGEQLPPPPALIENEYSLLDVTDLVFIDPVGTGYSKPAEGVEGKEFWGVEEDLESVGQFIVQWITENKRWDSPKFLAGESYGTTRASGLGALLQDKHGVYLNGIVLVSVVLNMATIRFTEGNDLPYILYLPSYAATGWFHQQLPADLQAKPLDELCAEVREYAQTDYAMALLRGNTLPEREMKRVLRRVARYTGIDATYLERSHLRVPMGRYNKELLREQARTVGRFDSRYLGLDRDSVGEHYEFDASYTAVQGAFTGAFNKYIRADLGYESDVRYQILGGLGAPWNYGEFQNRFLDVSDRLRSAMTRNPSLRVFVANGYYDLATPFFATEYTFSHLRLDDSLADNVSMGYYAAGHMMYAKESELAKLAGDIKGWLRG